MYGKLHKRCDEPEKNNKELLAYKRSAACKLAMCGLRAMREGAGIKDTDTSTCWGPGQRRVQGQAIRVRAGARGPRVRMLHGAQGRLVHGEPGQGPPHPRVPVGGRVLPSRAHGGADGGRGPRSCPREPPNRETATTPNTRRPKTRPLYPSNSPLGFVLCAHSTCLAKANVTRYCARRCASIK